ncbi:hypothetical protein Tco_0326663 [Tanacetum coccineum]
MMPESSINYSRVVNSPTRLKWKIGTVEDLSLNEGIDYLLDTYTFHYEAKTLKKGETLKKGSPFKPDSETNIPLLRPFQLWKKARYEALRKSDQMHQAFEKGSIGMTYKLGDMIEFPKSQPKKTYKEDLECNLDKMEDEVGNLSPESTPRVLPSFKEYTPPVTYSEEVEECWIIF